ncbi:GGDEF domain-containing protein [Couchioplanes azureus]|uniref:GGDEF domain-containing protein n=1 Tax=Couchioplanes caeruleus TaxID=56438 RepID=UPI001670F01E|nr:GGDEF domain-containing protein [Couchioplanes caeruleus]
MRGRGWMVVAAATAAAIAGLRLLPDDPRWTVAWQAATLTLLALLVVRTARLSRRVAGQSRQIRELARTDELTGLPNRRAWNEELPRALEHARREGTPVCIAVLDLDRFRRFNEEHGPAAGDRFLKAAGAAWHGALRRVDTLARDGGEEFAVLLPGADLDKARAAVGRALAATPLGQTFSAGVALWDGAETPDELVARADAALYAAKAGGRNRIVAAGAGAGPDAHMRSSA